MDTLNVDSIEIVSQTRIAPLNGAPSSEDFNDFQKESLSDLVSIVTFLNDTLMPMLRALSAVAADGLDGTGLFSDPAETSSLFKDTSGNPLTVSESFSVLYGMVQTLSQKVSDLDASVGELTQRLSATGTNDVASVLRGLQDSLNALSNRVGALEQA